jgi:hypothetical protein
MVNRLHTFRIETEGNLKLHSFCESSELYRTTTYLHLVLNLITHGKVPLHLQGMVHKHRHIAHFS